MRVCVCVRVCICVYMCLRVSVCVGVHVLFQVHRTPEVSLWHSTQDIHYASFLFVCMHAITTRSVRDEYVYLSDICGLQTSDFLYNSGFCFCFGLFLIYFESEIRQGEFLGIKVGFAIYFSRVCSVWGIIFTPFWTR